MAHTYRFMGGLARVCGYTRVSGVLEGVGGQRPIGSKHSLSERVSWTHASCTRRGLGLPLLERSELSFFLSLSPPFFFFFFSFFHGRCILPSTAILICLEFAFHAATTTCIHPGVVQEVSSLLLFLIFKVSFFFFAFSFLVKIYFFLSFKEKKANF